MSRLHSRPLLLVTTILVVAAGAPAATRAETVEIKMATLAPSGSAWAKRLERGVKKVSEATEGRVKLKWFYGGQQGDEKDVVAKIELGQLDGAALTAAGLGIIDSDVRVLELPMLFRSTEEIDYVRSKMDPEFEQSFLDAGYVLLAWGDLGWTHVYTTVEVKSLADMRKLKVWTRTDDPIMRAYHKVLKLNGVPLAVPEVFSALATGVIDVCFGPPLAAIAMQWYTKVKFASVQPMSYAIGALLVRKSVWDRLRPEDQKVVLELHRAARREGEAQIRKDNERAKKALARAGITFVEMPKEALAELEKQARIVWYDLAGEVYPKELLERVLALIAEKRGGG